MQVSVKMSPSAFAFQELSTALSRFTVSQSVTEELTVHVVAVIFLLWAYLPEQYLEDWGVTWYPR
jgi:hypothetical protein